MEELRSISGEGCTRGAAGGGELLRQAVLDSLQQFKQYMRHTSTGGHNTSLEVRIGIICFQYFIYVKREE